VRFLFSFAGGTGHAEPMVGVALAVQAAGHQVIFAGDERYLPRLRRSGLAATATDESAGVPQNRQDLIEPSQRREDDVVRNYFIGRLPRQRWERSAQLYASWRPDVVVRDEADFGAAVLAEVLGIPRAAVLIGASGDMFAPPVIADALDELRAEHGLPPDPQLVALAGDLVLSPFPLSLRAVDRAHAFNPGAGVADPERLPRWWSDLGEQPIIYLTLGTIFPLESGNLFDRILAALDGLPAAVVATVGPDLDPVDLGPQPANVRIERWLPQARLFRDVDLVIHHGGSGTMGDAARNGVPQIVLAMGADQLHNARRLEELGLGRSLPATSATTALIRDSVVALLTDLRVRDNAERLERESAALPGPDSAVPLLERLSRDGRTGHAAERFRHHGGSSPDGCAG
jgi:UDP:flavonoid glycosyltransferase YjiC (YdhE family)